MKPQINRRRFATLVLIAIGFSLTAQEAADALFDRARQTTSLKEYYHARKKDESQANPSLLSLGIESIILKDYSVLTDYGSQEFNINVGYSYSRIDCAAYLPRESKFVFRGFDLSGKSVVIGKSFTVGEEGYFDPYGRVLQEDLSVALFTVFHVPIDIGVIRSRISDDIDETGVRGEFGFNTIEYYFGPSENDKYALYLNNTPFGFLDLNLILGGTVSSVTPKIGIPKLLKLTGVNQMDGRYTSKIRQGDVWGNFSGSELTFGTDFEISDYPSWKRADGTFKKKVENYGAGLAFNAEYELLKQSDTSARIEAGAGNELFVLKLAGSYFQDPLLGAFGAASNAAVGGRATFEIIPIAQFSFIVSTAFNFVDDIRFMTGAYDHPVIRILLNARL